MLIPLFIIIPDTLADLPLWRTYTVGTEKERKEGLGGSSSRLSFVTLYWTREQGRAGNFRTRGEKQVSMSITEQQSAG